MQGGDRARQAGSNLPFRHGVRRETSAPLTGEGGGGGVAWPMEHSPAWAFRVPMQKIYYERGVYSVYILYINGTMIGVCHQ
jgi:hypothetical protein